jgi:hypothetical protein
MTVKIQEKRLMGDLQNGESLDFRLSPTLNLGFHNG